MLGILHASRLLCRGPYLASRCESSDVKLVDLHGMSGLEGPVLTSVKDSRENYCSVDFQLGVKVETTILPDVSEKFVRAALALMNLC